MALSVESLVLEIGRALAPLEQRLRAGEIRLLFAELGLPAPDTVLGSPGVGTAIEQAADALAALPDALAELAGALESADPVEIAQAGSRALPLVDTATAAIEAIGAGIEAAAGGDHEIEAFAAELAERLFGFALAIYLSAAGRWSRICSCCSASSRSPRMPPPPWRRPTSGAYSGSTASRR